MYSKMGICFVPGAILNEIDFSICCHPRQTTKLCYYTTYKLISTTTNPMSHTIYRMDALCRLQNP